MMDAPMIDVVASLPLAVEMREALVARKGKRGILLDCVAALETGEISDMPSIVERAGEIYLESLMWANSAAESLFAAAAPAKPSTPPPVSHPAAAPAPVPPLPALDVTADDRPPRPAPRGVFARVFARLFGWRGRRVGHGSA